MTALTLAAALIVFALQCFGLALLGLASDKLRIAARWRLWYHKTFGKDETDEGV